MSAVITQNNIADVIKSDINNSKAIGTLINTVLSSIDKIVKTNKNLTSTTVNNIKNIKNVVIVYNDMVNSIINTLCVNGDDKTNKNLANLLGRIVEIENNDSRNKINSTKFTTIEAAMQIPKVIESMFGIFEKIGNMNIKFKAIMRFRINILLMKSILNDLLEEFISIFSEMDIDSNKLNAVISFLITDPNTIDKILSTKQNDESVNNKTLHNHVGLLDVFERTITLLDMLNSLKVPNFAELNIKFYKMKNSLKALLNSLMEFSDKNASKENHLKMIKLENIILGELNSNGQRRGGVLSIVDGITKLFTSLNSVNVNKKNIKHLYKSLNIIEDILDKCIILKPKFRSISSNAFINYITNTKQVFISLNEIFINAKNMILNSILITIGYRFVKIGINVITSIIDSISKLSKKATTINISGIETIENIFNSLRKISINTILISALVLPSIIALSIITVYVASLVVFISTINVLLNAIKGITNTSIKRISGINSIFVSLMLVGATILVFAMLTPVIIQALIYNITGFIGVLVVSILMLCGSIQLVSIITKQGVKASISVSVNIILIMGALIMSSLVILSASAVANVISWDNIGSIIMVLLGMIAITATMVLLGMALSAASAFIGFAIIGLTPVITLIGMLLFTGLALVALGKFNFDFGEFNKDKQGNITAKGIKGNVGIILDFINWFYDQIGNKTISDVKQARRSKRYIRQISKTVDVIKEIATSLNEIQLIELKRETIIANVIAIFDVINELNARLYGGSYKDENGSIHTIEGLLTEKEINEDNISILRPIKLINSAINQKENKSKRKLNRINKVIKTLNNVGGSLMSIKEFNFDRTTRETITKNITDLFEFVNNISGKIDDFMKPTEESVEAVKGVKSLIKFTKNKLDERQKNRQFNKSDEKLSTIETVILSLSSITESIKTIGEIEIGDVNDTKSLAFKANKSVKDAIGCSVQIMNSIKSKIQEVKKVDDFAEAFNPINICIKDLTENITTFSSIDNTKLDKNINSFNNFIDKVNSLDIEKTQKTAQMFEHMSNFSNTIKGNFEGLAESLNDDLMPTLDRLEQLLKDVNTIFKETHEKLEQITNTTMDNAKMNLASMSDEQIESLARQRVKSGKSNYSKDLEKEIKLLKDDRAQQRASSIEAKLDMLYDLFCGNGAGGSQYAIVKTKS